MLFSRLPDIGNRHLGRSRKRFDIQRRQLEVVMMGSVSLRRSGSMVARLAEIIDALSEPLRFGLDAVADPLRQQSSLAHDVVKTPMMERAGRRVRIFNNEGEAFGSRWWIRPLQRR